MIFLYKNQSPIPKLLQNNNNIFLYGHRGLSKHRLENTLSSFQYAISCKMDGIELDIQKTIDNEIIVFHDENLEKINGNITPITKMDFGDIKKINLSSKGESEKAQYIPKLTDVIKITPNDVVLNIEIKYFNSMQDGMEKNIVYLFDKYNLYGKVAYPKKHLPSQIPALYRWAASRGGVFVNPALTEPFGLTLLEASSCGLPIISTNDGGPKEIRSKCENGLLVDVTDINELKIILEKGISNNNQWKIWSRNGIEGVNRHFSWNTHVRNYLSLLTKEFSSSNSYSSSDIKQSCLKGTSSLIKPH